MLAVGDCNWKPNRQLAPNRQHVARSFRASVADSSSSLRPRPDRRRKSLEKASTATDDDARVEELGQVIEVSNGRIFKRQARQIPAERWVAEKDYNPHIWDIRCGNKKTPMEVFLDDRLFKKAIAKRLALGSYLSDGGIRKALSTFSGTQRVSTFRPSAAASIYHELLPARGGVTWDCCAGFGGRLLGSLACRRVRRYVATEPSTATMQGLKEMRDELVPLSGRKISIELHHVGSETFHPDRNSLDLIFSSPPYAANERYSDEPTQSYIKFPTRTAWLEGFLGGTLANCRRGLKQGGLLAVNITGVPSYPRLESDFLALAKREGWKLRTTFRIEMSRMVGTRIHNGGSAVKTEPLFVFAKQ